MEQEFEPYRLAGYRKAMHARALDLPHPAGGRLIVEAPLPPHMSETFKTLGFEARPPADPARTR